MSARRAFAAVHAVESMLEHGRGEEGRLRRQLTDADIARGAAAWEEIDAEARRYLRASWANQTVDRILVMLRRAADEEITDRAPTPMCPTCGAQVALRCTTCGWFPPG